MPALVLDGLAELQVRWLTVPIAFCATRGLAGSAPVGSWPTAHQ
jgi:hypothetical protein